MPRSSRFLSGLLTLVVADCACEADAQVDLHPVSTLYAADGATDDEFGYAVVANDDWIIASAPSEGVNGAVYAYSRTNLMQEYKITSSNPKTERFGHSLSLDGNLLVVGDPNHDNDTGRASIFQFDDGAWWYRNAIAGLQPGDELGEDVSVDLASEWIVAGAPGNDGYALVYKASPGGTLWYETTLTPGWATGLSYGHSVALDGNVVAIGEPMYGGGRGRIRMYEWNGALWTARSSMVHPDSQSGDLTGWDVCMDGGRVLAGAPYHSATAIDAGAAFLFERSGNDWNPTATLLASYGEADDMLGQSVQLAGGLASAGSPRADTPSLNSGAVSQWRLRDGAWIETQRLVENIHDSEARQGEDHALHGGETFVGAVGRNHLFDGTQDLGAVSIYDVPDIALEVTPPNAWPHQNVQVRHAGGDPNALVMLYVIGVDDVPFLLKLARSHFQADGAWNLQGSYGSSLGGITIDLQSLSLAGGTLETSNVTPLTLW